MSLRRITIPVWCATKAEHVNPPEGPAALRRPVRHECCRCGACCRWPGPVRLTEAEIDLLAAAMGLTPEQFTSAYTGLTPDRRGLTLMEQANGACILLEDTGECRVHPVKPQQCRDFPLKWNFPGVEKCCPGILKME